MDAFTISAVLCPWRSSLSLLRGGKSRSSQRIFAKFKTGPALHSLLRRDCETSELRWLCQGKRMGTTN